MPVFKKIIGVLLLILGVILFRGTFLNFINAILRIVSRTEKFTPYDFGYTIRTFICLSIIAFLIYKMIKFSLKLIKNKKLEIDSLDKIYK